MSSNAATAKPPPKLQNPIKTASPMQMAEDGHCKCGALNPTLYCNRSGKMARNTNCLQIQFKWCGVLSSRQTWSEQLAPLPWGAILNFFLFLSDKTLRGWGVPVFNRKRQLFHIFCQSWCWKYVTHFVCTVYRESTIVTPLWPDHSLFKSYIFKQKHQTFKSNILFFSTKFITF